MSFIDRSKHEGKIDKVPDAFNKTETDSDIISDMELLQAEYKRILVDQNIKFSGTWLLERDLWLASESQLLPANTDTLSRGRVVLVNPGVSNIGREQKFVHPYVVLGEHKDTFIGVPITNMAKDKEGNFYLRHFFEVELKNPEGKKPYNQYRCTKPSVADVRNIAGLDKRRIIQDQLYTAKKFAPKTYLDAISRKIISSLAAL